MPSSLQRWVTAQTRGGAFQSGWLILRSEVLRKSYPKVCLGRRNEEGRCCTDLGEEGRAPRAGVEGAFGRSPTVQQEAWEWSPPWTEGAGRQHHAMLPLVWLQTQSNWQLHSGAANAIMPLSLIFSWAGAGAPLCTFISTSYHKFRIRL